MSDTTRKTWNDDEKLAFEVWKYHGGIGGADKNTMIKIVTWLLGFSSAMIGFYATGKVTEPLASVLLIVLGVLFSVLAAFTALLYGGYATWNWATADRIAEAYNWTELRPNYNPFARSKAHWPSAFPLWLAKPCQDKIAPVFWLFFVVSIASFCVHVALLFHVALTSNK